MYKLLVALPAIAGITFAQIAPQIMAQVISVETANAQSKSGSRTTQTRPPAAKPPNSDLDGECFMVSSSGKVISLSALCGAPPPSIAQPQLRSPALNNSGVVIATIKRKAGGIPIIDVAFSNNGTEKTFEMMVDTGASGILVTDEMATSLGISPIGYVNSKTPGGAIRLPAGYVESVSASGATVNKVGVLISPIMEIGLLGQNFLVKFDMTIKKDVIEFRPRN